MFPTIEYAEEATGNIPIEELVSNIDWSRTNVTGFLYKGNSLCRQEKKQDGLGNYKLVNRKICNKIKVLALQRDFDTQELTAKIAFRFRNDNAVVDVSMQQLSYKELANLTKHGMFIAKPDEQIISWFLFEQAETAPMYCIHGQLGFRMYNEHPVYLHNIGIGVDTVYDGNLPIKPTGSYDEWYRFVNTEIVPHVPAVIPLVIGFSSLILGFMSLYRPVQSIITHFWGKHGTGKTTAEYIALSIFGLPSEKSGLLLPWISTANSLAGSLRNCYGMCFAFDDSSTAGSRDLSSLLYTVANSQERKRMTKDLKIRDTASWAVNVISSGEFDILEFCQKTSGLEDRILRFQNLPITKDAEHSDNIKLVLSRNYGFAAPIFAEYLIELGIDKVEETFQAISSEISSWNGSEDISPRHKDKISTILTAAKLCADCFSFDIDYPLLEKTFLDNELSGKDERNTGQQAFDMVCDFVETNIKKFHREDNTCTATECYGKIIFIKASEGRQDNGDYKYHSRVYFIRTMLDELLKKRGFLNPKQIYAEWKELGVLYTNEASHFGVKAKSLGKDRAIAITIPFQVGIITDDSEGTFFLKNLVKPGDGEINF